MTPERRKTTLLQSFDHAFQGLVYSVRHQRNMRIHFAVAVVVLVASVFLDVSRLELVVVFVTIAFVLMAELINTAVEAVVDIITDEFDPRAKAAKDVAAGAVLVAAINSLVVAYLVLADRLAHVSLELLTTIRRSPAHLTIVALAVVAIRRDRDQSHSWQGDAALRRSAVGARGSRVRRMDGGDFRGRRHASRSSGERHCFHNGGPGRTEPDGDGHPLLP